MGKITREFFKKVEEKSNYYFSEYGIAREWLEFRANIHYYFSPLPTMEEKEDTKDYVSRLSPDQALTYSGYLLEMWRLNKKLVDNADISTAPKKVWLKMNKQREEILEGAEFTEMLYAQSLERKRRYDNS